MTNSYTIATPILSFVCSFVDRMFIDRQDPQGKGCCGAILVGVMCRKRRAQATPTRSVFFENETLRLRHSANVNDSLCYENQQKYTAFDDLAGDRSSSQ